MPQKSLNGRNNTIRNEADRKYLINFLNKKININTKNTQSKN